jgi:hypothetical protein
MRSVPSCDELSKLHTPPTSNRLTSKPSQALYRQLVMTPWHSRYQALKMRILTQARCSGLAQIACLGVGEAGIDGDKAAY